MPDRSFARGVVVTPHVLASEAGASVLAAGGNAMDAVIAANLALGVVAPYYCGPGGDLFAIVWDGALHGYRSTGRSPRATDVARLRRDGHAHMPVFGAHAVTVPGAVRGWFDLLERFGTRTLAEIVAPAVTLADDGFVLTKPGAFRVRGSVAMIEAMLGDGAAALRATYGGHAEGDRLRSPGLARTLRTIADDGPNAFYEGPIGAAIVATLGEHGGVMSETDLAAHQSAWVEPLTLTYGGRVVAELPPPTQGVTALEMLALAGVRAERHGSEPGRSVGPSTDRDHEFAEIAKLALADRDRFVSDPAHMTIDPRELLDREALDERAALVSHRAAPMGVRARVDGGTAYLCAADADGLCVSLIQSNFTAIGSGVHVPEWGINLHNRGASFSLDPDSVNVLAPAKLPMHTLIPAMVLRDGEPEFVFGTMGGHAQAQVHLQILTRLLVDGAGLQEAIDAPRWAVDPVAGTLQAEGRHSDEWFAEMSERGHDVRRLRDYDDGVGHAHVIGANGLRAAADPRAESAARGL